MVTEKSILPLRVNNVTVSKRDKLILNNITTEIRGSGITVIMGPNGAGKTTLLRAMHGLERIISGKITWNLKQSEARGQQAFVFQTPIILRRSVLNNIAYPLHVRKAENALALAEQWANQIGLGTSLELNALFLSGGEKQKLAIARALICKPDVLFLDEPTTNLDGQSTKEIEEVLLSAQQRGTKIIMTTHNLGQAKRLASDVIFLNQGKLYEQTKAQLFFKSPKTTQAKAYIQGDIVE
ncbi:MAG: ATP-binding cassette domain-containing protein [Rhizobiaceae bacterium]